MRPSQDPTCVGMRVRSTRDANVIFHAVALSILPMVVRRLDAADRAALRPGCVYVWEERAPSSDATGVGMERFTEGRHWHPSRVRDDFLLYLEKDWDTPETQLAEKSRMLRRHRDSFPSTSYSSPVFPIQPNQRSPMIKQTYSAWVNTSNGPKKWHMNAYYTEDSLEELHTVDDVPALAGLKVPHECYQRARSTTTSGGKSRDRNSQRDPMHVDGPRVHMPRRNSTASADSQASERESFVSFSQHKFAAYSITPGPRTAQSSNPEARRNSVGSSGESGTAHTHTGVQAQKPSSDRCPRIAPSLPPFHVPSNSPSLSVAVKSLRKTTQQHSPATPPSSSPLSTHLSTSYDYPNSPNAPSPLSLSPAVCQTGDWQSTGQSSEQDGHFPPHHRQLVPLDRLASMQISRRDPVDDEALRSFRPL